MPITGYHAFTSPVADGTNTQLVRPSDWNSSHVFTVNLSGNEISNAFSNANGVSFGTSGGAITASVATNYAASDHSHGNPTLALTNLSGTTASNSAGFTLSLSAALGGGAGDGYNILAAGTQTAGTANTVLFNNGNGITFGMSNSSIITASHNGLTQQSTQPVAYSAANGSANFSTLTFANSNGVSFSTGTQGLYATVKTDYLTTARASNDAVGLNTALTAGPLAWTVNSGGISLNAGSAAGTSSGFAGNLISGSITHNTAGINVSLNHPAWLTTAAVSNHSHGYSAANGSAAFQTLTFANSNGVSFSTGTQGLYATVATNYAASDHSHGNPTLALTNLTGTTASNSAGFTLSLSANAPGAAAENNWFNLQGNTASNSTASGSTIMLSAGNNITLAATNGSVIRIDGAAGGAGDGYNIVQIGTTGTSGTAWSSASATVRLNGDGVIMLTQNNSNDIGVNHAAVNQFIPYYPASTGAMGIAGAIGASSGSVLFFPISVGEPVIANRIRIHHTVSHVTSSVSGRQTLGMQWGLFSNNAGTALSRMTSNSLSFAITNSSGSATLSYATASSDSGYGYGTTSASTSALIQSLWGTVSNRAIDFMLGGTSYLTPGMYWLGVLHTASTSSAAVGLSVHQAGNAMAGGQNILPMGVSSAAANAGFDFGWGNLTITTTGMVQSAAVTNISNTATQLPMVTFMSM